jgi:hypothetical protein
MSKRKELIGRLEWAMIAMQSGSVISEEMSVSNEELLLEVIKILKECDCKVKSP